jgi:hypothetical protein
VNGTTSVDNSTLLSFEPLVKVYQPLDYAFWALAGVYFLLVLFPLVQVSDSRAVQRSRSDRRRQLIRLHTSSRMPLLMWSRQKNFLALLLFVDTGRFLYFALTPWFQQSFNVESLDLAWIWGLDQLCTLVFMSTFASLVLFWVEIIYHAKYHERSTLLRPVFFAINVVVYVLVSALVGLMVVEKQQPKSAAQKAKIDLFNLIDHSFYAAVSLILAVLFVVFGVRLFSLLKSNPIRSQGRTAKLREVGSITPICATSFTLRALMRLLMALVPVYDLGLQKQWWYVLIFYVVSEVLPALLVLYVLRKMPPRYSKTAVNINNATYNAVAQAAQAQTQKAKLPQQFTAVSRSRV